MKRRAMCLTAAAALVAAAATGCSTQKTVDGATGVKTLVMTAGGSPVFTQNFNIFAPTTADLMPGSNLIYEPLLAVNRSTSSAEPWLATADTWSDGGKVLTFTLRQGVKWSDGTDFTSADVVFSLKLEGGSQAPWTSVTAEGPSTVKVTYPQAGYGDLSNFAGSNLRVMVPEHVWSKQSTKTWTNPNPVGTGPFTLKTFTPQAVTFAARGDYWGGASKGVKDVQIVPGTQDDATESRMNAGTQDWATIGWPDVQQEYVDKDPAHHIYRFYSCGSTEGPVFNVTKAPLNDVHVRQALVDALDATQIQKTVGMGSPAGSTSGLDPAVWGGDLPSDIDAVMTLNTAKAKAELAAGGWTISGGNLTKDGKSYPLTYNVYQPYPVWVTEAQLAAAQWQVNLGLNVTVVQMGDAQFNAADASGNFQIDSNTQTNGGIDMDTVYNVYGAAAFVPTGQSAYANTGRWQDPQFNSLLNQYDTISPADPAQRAAVAQQLTQEVANQAPFVPLAASGWKAEMNTNNWTGWPTTNATYVPNTTLSPDAAETLWNLTPTN
jgi:peptide/nickel transport system substrate-binding protein